MGTPTKRVLIIDDEKKHLDDVRAALTPIACEIDSAISMYEAHTMLDANTYDLVISDNDIQFERGGIELLMLMRTQFPQHKETPFILHTGDEEPAVTEKLKRFNGVYCNKYSWREPDRLKGLIADALA